MLELFSVERILVEIIFVDSRFAVEENGCRCSHVSSVNDDIEPNNEREEWEQEEPARWRHVVIIKHDREHEPNETHQNAKPQANGSISFENVVFSSIGLDEFRSSCEVIEIEHISDILMRFWDQRAADLLASDWIREGDSFIDGGIATVSLDGQLDFIEDLQVESA